MKQGARFLAVLLALQCPGIDAYAGASTALRNGKNSFLGAGKGYSNGQRKRALRLNLPLNSAPSLVPATAAIFPVARPEGVSAQATNASARVKKSRSAPTKKPSYPAIISKPAVIGGRAPGKIPVAASPRDHARHTFFAQPDGNAENGDTVFNNASQEFKSIGDASLGDASQTLGSAFDNSAEETGPAVDAITIPFGSLQHNLLGYAAADDSSARDTLFALHAGNSDVLGPQAPEQPRRSLSRSFKAGVVGWILITVFAAAVSMVQAQTGLEFTSDYAGDAVLTELISSGILSRAAAFAMVVVYAPVVEEFWFRGALVGGSILLMTAIHRATARLSEKIHGRTTRAWAAMKPIMAIGIVLGVSLLFALVHETTNPFKIAQYVIMAAIFSALFYKEGLLSAIIAHAVNNLFVYFMTIYTLGLGAFGAYSVIFGVFLALSGMQYFSFLDYAKNPGRPSGFLEKLWLPPSIPAATLLIGAIMAVSLFPPLTQAVNAVIAAAFAQFPLAASAAMFALAGLGIYILVQAALKMLSFWFWQLIKDWKERRAALWEPYPMTPTVTRLLAVAVIASALLTSLMPAELQGLMKATPLGLLIIGGLPLGAYLLFQQVRSNPPKTETAEN